MFISRLKSISRRLPMIIDGEYKDIRLGDLHPIKYKFWCITRNIMFKLFLGVRKLYGKIDEIHYDYWTKGKSLKELQKEATNE